MCGICGIVDYKGLSPDIETMLESMVATLRHRGPDEKGVWNNEIAGLGHARLSIIDLHEGRQPLSNEDGSIWISYNGEVYNFPELRSELEGKGHRFRTHTDTEVIVHLYEEEGIECVERLRGMFAFAIWDGRKQELYLVRDRLGIKPVYYSSEGGRLVFGSEIKAILAGPKRERRICPEALSDYLTLQYVPAPKSMFAGIHKLEAGHWLRFDRKGLETRMYWDLEPTEPFGMDRTALERGIIEQLREAVSMRLISDVPLGAFLSGGVDSSAVVAMMAAVGQDPLIAISIGFDESQYNELPYARKTAQRYAKEHYEEIVRPSAVDIVDALAWHFDEPFADFSSIPTYYVSEAARKHVTVALSGDGGDENYGGYPRYRWHLTEQRLRRWLLPGVGRWGVGMLSRVWPDGDWLAKGLRAKQTLAKVAMDPLTSYLRSVGFILDHEKPAVLHADVLASLGDYRSAEIIDQCMRRGKRRGLDQLSYTEIKTYLVDDILTKVDRASMAVSLEVRVPLLDHSFVEYASGVPAKWKIEGRQGKAILKTALRPYVDDDVLYRPKSGFTPPLGEWMRDPLRPMLHDVLLGSDSYSHTYIRREAIERFVREHMAGQNRTHILWMFLMFELWCRKFL